MLEDFDKKGMDAIFGSKQQTALPSGTVYDNLKNFSATPQNAVSVENSGEKKKYF